MILSVSSISAGDLDDDSLSDLSVVGDSNIDIISDGDVNGISNERSSAESVLEDADNSEIIFQNDFEELSYRINNTPEGDLLVLDKNYKFTNEDIDISNY